MRDQVLSGFVGPRPLHARHHVSILDGKSWHRVKLHVQVLEGQAGIGLSVADDLLKEKITNGHGNC